MVCSVCYVTFVITEQLAFLQEVAHTVESTVY